MFLKILSLPLHLFSTLPLQTQKCNSKNNNSIFIIILTANLTIMCLLPALPYTRLRYCKKDLCFSLLAGLCTFFNQDCLP